MPKHLYVIANATNVGVTYSSTEHSGDTVAVPAHSIVHTGGADGNFVDIANCSAEKHYDKHHDSLDGAGLNLTFWNNNDQNGLLFFSTNGTFAGGQPVTGSNQYNNCMLLVYSDSNGNLGWTVAPY